MVGQLVDPEGVRVQGPPDGVDFGAAVRLVWRTDEAEQALPAWALA
jgi:hypothetical protein